MTDLVYILDRSGSMSGMEEAAVTAFNDFLRTQMDVPGEARLTLIQFDDQYEVNHHRMVLERVPHMLASHYEPRGGTALLDAIGRTIKEISRYINTPEHKAIFAIFTDGAENASQAYTMAHVSDLIAEKRKQGWTFLFLAANQDAIATAANLNIAQHDASQVNYSKSGVKSTGSAFGRKARAIRAVANRPAPQLSEQEKEDLSKPLSEIVEEEGGKE
jgi:Mg-chelatase subunit ChlD